MTADAALAARRSPLTDHAGRLVAGSREGVVALKEVPFLAQVGLRVPVGDTAARRACSAAIGLDLPDRAGTAAGDAERSALWLGPDEWLVVGTPNSEAEIIEALSEAVADAHASAVDLSANRTTLELSGPMARDVLEGGCHLDLHPRAFGLGSCAATTLARAAVYLHQLDDAPTYRILVRNSFAAYLADWLLDAMTEHTAEA